MLRLALLIGGLVIIVDLAATALAQRTVSADDAAAISQLDDLLNYLLFSLLGVLVARDTGLMYSGALAGVLASLLDAIVVTAAAVLAPPSPPPLDVLEFGFARNLVIGTVFAGLAGVVYLLAQRWSGGRRSR
jgi:hypothetical protein